MLQVTMNLQFATLSHLHHCLDNAMSAAEINIPVCSKTRTVSSSVELAAFQLSVQSTAFSTWLPSCSPGRKRMSCLKMSTSEGAIMYVLGNTRWSAWAALAMHLAEVLPSIALNDAGHSVGSPSSYWKLVMLCTTEIQPTLLEHGGQLCWSRQSGASQPSALSTCKWMFRSTAR